MFNGMLRNGDCEVKNASFPREETTRGRLERNKKTLLDHLEDINKALELLAKHPEMEELQDLLRRVG